MVSKKWRGYLDSVKIGAVREYKHELFMKELGSTKNKFKRFIRKLLKRKLKE